MEGSSLEAVFLPAACLPSAIPCLWVRPSPPPGAAVTGTYSGRQLMTSALLPGPTGHRWPVGWPALTHLHSTAQDSVNGSSEVPAGPLSIINNVSIFHNRSLIKVILRHLSGSLQWGCALVWSFSVKGSARPRSCLPPPSNPFRNLPLQPGSVSPAGWPRSSEPPCARHQPSALRGCQTGCSSFCE